MTDRPHRRLLPAAALALTVLLGACTADDPEPPAASASPSPSPSASPSESGTPDEVPDATPTEELPDPEPMADVRIRRIPDRQWDRIVATGTWRPECPAGREDLRRIEVNHWTFDGEIRRGVLVANQDVAESLGRIFTRLFDRRFPIEQMRPVEQFDGDTNASLRANNTSAYNCRRPDQINAPVTESPHANGRAIDINPWQNPWTDLRCRCWLPTAKTRSREPRPGVIYEGGLVWRLFTREGWIWQNIDVPDYMHFDTGYPSRPFEPRTTG